MRFDINETLLRHVATGAGAAHTLRAEVARFSTDDVGETVARFLGARSDLRRLLRAQDVAKLVLRADDFADIMDVRKIVAEQEQGRLISYSRQKDHTAHTVYLYLLGIWMFDREPVLYLAIVCDELQKWDRYAAGDDVVEQIEQADRDSVESVDMELICTGTDERRALLRIAHPDQIDMANKLRKTLEARAPGYEKILKIEEYCPPADRKLQSTDGPRGLT